MVESLLLRLKESAGLEGRITAEFLDEGDCVGEWFIILLQSCCTLLQGTEVAVPVGWFRSLQYWKRGGGRGSPGT
jgi:hypothetical protein